MGATPHCVVRERKGVRADEDDRHHDFEREGEGTRYTWSIEFVGPWPAVALGAQLFGRAIEAQQRTLESYLKSQR